MKTFSVLLITVLFYACSSPDKEGKAFGSKYCDCLGDSKSFTSAQQFTQRKDSCDGALKEGWDNYETKYKQDAGNWKVLVTAFQNTTQKTVQDFNVLYSRVIMNGLGDNFWVKDNDAEPIYLYSFNNLTLKMPNCKGEFGYKLSGDTLLFDDGKHTKAIIEFSGQDKFIFINPDNNQRISYHKAKEKDKILGKWYEYVDYSYSQFKPDGTYILSEEGFSPGKFNYSINDNMVLTTGGGSSEAKFDGNDDYTWIENNAIKYHSKRIKNPQPNNLKILFTTNN